MEQGEEFRTEPLTVMTFKNSSAQMTGKKLFLNDQVVVFAKVEKLDDRAGRVSYVCMNQNREEIMRGVVE